MKIKENLKKIVSAVLTASMLIGVSPMITPITTYAAQSNDYVDPADSWLEQPYKRIGRQRNCNFRNAVVFCVQ